MKPGFPWISSALAAEPGAVNAQSPAVPTVNADVPPMTDIHDIKPLLAPGPDLRWLYWALGIAAVLLLAALAWRLWKKRKKPAAAQPDSPPIPAETEAYQMLDALAADGDLHPKQFYFRLSAILRRYIERRYDIPAAEMTTEELLPKVDRLHLGIELAQPLKAFCRVADPIKFADAPADKARMATDMAFARDFVRKTTEMLKTDVGNADRAQPDAALQTKALPLVSADSERRNDLTR